MPLKKRCANCQSIDCSADNQQDFAGLQVTVAEQHDQTLVDARMLGVHSSTESRKTTDKSKDMSMKKRSDYWLKRIMASFDKMHTFLCRLPRANTHAQLEAHVPSETLQRSDTN